jgi:ketosteroid isomerase-like protein
MTPKQLVLTWVDSFNAADVDGLSALYAEDAVNHQVVMAPLHGRAAIRRMFEIEVSRASMHCTLEAPHEAGDWAILGCARRDR